MPFTVAHPAAVIPLHRSLPRWTVPSALVIGSIAPDLAYFLPARIPRAESHSVAGLFWFCLPVGCAVYVLFHLVMKHPMLRLAPVDIARRLGSVVGPPRGLQSRPWLPIGISLLLGAATHLGWDAFTHGGTPVLRADRFLRAPLLAIGSYPLSTYTVLQHGSTVFGVVVLGWWIRRWLQTAPIGPAPSAPISGRERVVAITILVAVPVACGIVVALSRLSSSVTDAHLQKAVGKGLVSAFASFGATLFTFSTWWQLAVRHRAIAAREEVSRS